MTEMRSATTALLQIGISHPAARDAFHSADLAERRTIPVVE